MNVKKYTLVALGSVALVTATVMSSCIKENPDSPGWEYMPDMYRSPAPETNGVYISAATPDSMANRLPAPGSIPRGWTPFPYENSPLGDTLASKFWFNPWKATDSLEERGKFLYERNCVYCHGTAGDGQGKLVTSGKYPNQPPSYIDLYKKNSLSDGHVYHVITYGKGNMGSHAVQLDPQERWLVTMYVQRLGRGGSPASEMQKQNNQPKSDSAAGADTVKAGAGAHVAPAK